MAKDQNYVPRVVRPQPGHHYYAAKCPITSQILLIEEDQSRGMKPYPFAEALVSCHHCQSAHRFLGQEVLSLREPEAE